jgi:hypothetical protein
MHRLTMIALVGGLLLQPWAAFADGARDDKAHKLEPLRAGSKLALLPVAAGSGADSEAAVRAISENLRHRGYKVLSPKEVRAKLGSHTPDGCRNPTTCDPSLALATLRSDAVVSIALWRRPKAPLQLAVHVRRERGYGQAEVEVHGDGASEVRAAALSALQNALDDSLRTHERQVLIDSQPSGASVHVDQTLTGKTPARFALLPGSHLVSVEAPGYVTRAQYLELADDAADGTQLTVQLTAADAAERATSEVAPKPAEAAAAHEATRDDELESPAPIAAQDFAPEPAPSPAPEPAASPLNYVFATVLFAAAAPLFANVVYGAATHGDCVGASDARGACGQRVRFGPRFFASLGAGAAAALGGSAFLIFQPITAETSEAPTGLLVRMQRTF